MLPCLELLPFLVLPSILKTLYCSYVVHVRTICSCSRLTQAAQDHLPWISLGVIILKPNIVPTHFVNNATVSQGLNGCKPCAKSCSSTKYKHWGVVITQNLGVNADCFLRAWNPQLPTPSVLVCYIVSVQRLMRN